MWLFVVITIWFSMFVYVNQVNAACNTSTDTNLAMCYPLGTTCIIDNVGVERPMTKTIENNVCVTTICDGSCAQPTGGVDVFSKRNQDRNE